MAILTRLFHWLESMYDQLMPIEPTTERLYSVNEAADLMGMSRQRLHQLLKDGRINAQRIGRFWFVPESEIGRVAPSTKKVGRPRTHRKYRKIQETPLTET